MLELTLTPLQRFLAGASLALLLVSALLGYQYWQNQARRNDLASQLATLQTTANKLNAERASSGRPAPFPNGSPNLELTSLILDSAAASDVTLDPIQAGALGTDTVGSDTYRTVTVEVEVKGALPQILDFFDRVERGNIKTIAFDDLQATDSEDQWSVRARVIAYAQSS